MPVTTLGYFGTILQAAERMRKLPSRIRELPLSRAMIPQSPQEIRIQNELSQIRLERAGILRSLTGKREELREAKTWWPPGVARGTFEPPWIRLERDIKVRKAKGEVDRFKAQDLKMVSRIKEKYKELQKIRAEKAKDIGIKKTRLSPKYLPHIRRRRRRRRLR